MTTAKIRDAEIVKTETLVPYKKNAKKHDEKQIRNVAESIQRFGFIQPIVADRRNVVIIGHCRLMAARLLGLREVPCIRAEDLSEDETRRLRLIDNKLNESPWDNDLLSQSVEGINLDGYDFSEDIADIFSTTEEGENPEANEIQDEAPEQAPEQSPKVADVFGVVPFSIIRKEDPRLTERREYWERALGV